MFKLFVLFICNDVSPFSLDPFPVLQTPPVVTGPNVLTDKSHGFQCEFDFDDDDPDQRFEIVWTFNGKTDPAIPMQLLSGAERTTTLDVSLLKAYVDANVSAESSKFNSLSFNAFFSKCSY